MKIGFHLVFNPIDVSYHYPLAFSYLKSYSERNSNINFTTVLLNSEKDVFAEKNMDIFGICTHSQDFDDAIRITEKLKQDNPGLIILMGGQHISHFPDTLPKSVDIGVIGEGEITFLELISLYDKEKKFNETNLRQIKGLIFRDSSGNLVRTEPRPLIDNIDDLGLPDRTFYPKDKNPYIFTSRGCPYKCAFCSSSEFWDKTRYFSPEYIYNDFLNLLKIYPDIPFIGVWDDLFVDDRSRLKKLRDLFKQNNLFKKHDFQMACQIRSNLIDKELCRLLHQLRITTVSFGFESAIDKTLYRIKPQTTMQKNLNALDILQKYNLPVCCSFIIGVPGETEADIKFTYELILKLMREDKLLEPHVNILMPMPNTIFWRQAEDTGLIDKKNFRWNRLRYFCCYKDSIFNTPEQWAEARIKNQSLYMNENCLKEKILLEIMVDYENKITKLLEEKKAKNKPPYKYFTYVNPSIANNAHSFIINKIKDNTKILECGSSGGHLTKVLSKKNCTVDCIEIDDTTANMAYQFANQIYIKNLEDENFIDSIASDKYDYILFCDVLEHLKNPKKCLSGLKDKLKAKGQVLASIPNIAHASIRLKLLKGKFEYEESGLLDKTHLRFYDFYSILNLFNEAGLFINEIDLVKIPIEHELSRINLDEFSENIIQEIKNDKTSEVFQYIVTAVKMKEKNELNNPDILFKKIFSEEFSQKTEKIIEKISLPQTPDMKKSASLLTKLKNKIQRLIR